ncbi:Uncharacterised protein [Serratia marcescens]|nr:Uncharacterised protein [Serratia marcescens]CUY62498.1 Uncharacterised protein [Serratia marcescens]CUY68757.1 Uncharacterised protein [Serratia marcescens]CVA67839.1 Uncharacterised protein [Serratia marcescens]CVA70996.1 Uncharacterised protein [Serratia marcescens]
MITLIYSMIRKTIVYSAILMMQAKGLVFLRF